MKFTKDYVVHSAHEDRVMQDMKIGERMARVETIGVKMELVPADGVGPTIPVSEYFSTDAEHAAFLAAYRPARAAVSQRGEKPEGDWSDDNPKPADHVEWHPGHDARSATSVRVTIEVGN